MKKLRVLLISRKNIQLVRLAGSFMVFGALLMLLYSVAYMFESWNAINNYTECIQSAKAEYAAAKKSISLNENAPVVSEADTLAQLRYMECRESLYKATGVLPLRAQEELTTKQKFMVFIKPVVWMFFWAVVFFFGVVLYNARVLALTFEEVSAKESKKRKR